MSKVFDLNINPLIFPEEKSNRRDSRRSFTQTQKKQILYQQDGKCAVCHKKLDPRATQFDHEKPWASGGRTKSENGRALCSDCHDKVTHQQRLEKLEGKKLTKKKSTKKSEPKNKAKKKKATTKDIVSLFKNPLF